MITLKITPGTSLDTACEMAAAQVRERKEPVEFEFNGVMVQVLAGETVDFLMEKAYKGRAQLERYKQAKFEHDLRTAVAKALPPFDYYDSSAMQPDIDRMLTAIRPFLRTP